MAEIIAAKRYDRALTLRGDDELFRAVKELQKLGEGELDMPTKSDVIRDAILNELDRKRKERRK